MTNDTSRWDVLDSSMTTVEALFVWAAFVALVFGLASTALNGLGIA